MTTGNEDETEKGFRPSSFFDSLPAKRKRETGRVNTPEKKRSGYAETEQFRAEKINALALKAKAGLPLFDD